MNKSLVVNSPFGYLEIVYQHDQIAKINLNSGLPESQAKNDFESEIIDQFEAYFCQPSFCFSLQLQPNGTPHQRKVWNLMKQIPAGQVKTYGEIAGLINSSAQAVGNACRQNPYPLVVPCHRVVAAGSIGGFAGKREGRLVDIKQRLLKHEGVEF